MPFMPYALWLSVGVPQETSSFCDYMRPQAADGPTRYRSSSALCRSSSASPSCRRAASR
jgi:hypothetical protein